VIPRDHVSITFVLSGIRAPKTARNEHERSEPYGPEALEFATRRYMQREVEVEFEAVDKTGGFIGAMYLNKTENAAITLVKEGLASVHAFSAEGLSWAKALMEAEEEAKKARKNVNFFLVVFFPPFPFLMTSPFEPGLGELHRGGRKSSSARSGECYTSKRGVYRRDRERHSYGRIRILGSNPEHRRWDRRLSPLGCYGLLKIFFRHSSSGEDDGRIRRVLQERAIASRLSAQSE